LKKGKQMQKRFLALVLKHRLGGLALCLFAAGTFAAFRAAAQEGATCGIVVTPDGNEQYWGACPNQNTQRQPVKPDFWGAIAVSKSTLMYGTAVKFSSEQAAKDFAVKECAKKGAKDCAVATTIANNLRVALATSPAEKAFSIGLSGATTFASSNATFRCQHAGGRSCKIAIAFCADDVDRSVAQHGGVFF
jgi:hypothetical protein